MTNLFLPSRPPTRARIGSLPVDSLDFDRALLGMLDLARAGLGGMVFTPNVDHVVRAEWDVAFRVAYQAASFCIADGMPLMWAARWLGTPLPQKISGSDWFEPLVAACSRTGRSLYFIGGRAGAGAAARIRLQAKYPQLKIVGVGPRTRDIEADPRLLDAVRDDLRRLRPDFAVVALGSPLQEIWSAEVRDAVAPTILLSLGSALDLAAGMVERAPTWLSRAGFEWLFRLGHEPRRLWRRYLLGGPKFLGIVWRQPRRRR